MKGRKIPETITEEEFISILKATKKPKKRLAYMLGFYQAMRISEITNLQLENVDYSMKLIRIIQAKGKKDRNIPIIKPLLLRPEQVKLAMKHLPINTTTRALQISFKNAANKILKKDLHFHCLRHSGASWLLNKKKWDIRQVQSFLGHSKLQTTEIYTHVSPEDLIALEWGDDAMK